MTSLSPVVPAAMLERSNVREAVAVVTTAPWAFTTFAALNWHWSVAEWLVEVMAAENCERNTFWVKGYDRTDEGTEGMAPESACIWVRTG